MKATAASATTHIFSVDVEEYFQVSAFDTLVHRDRWTTYPSRLAVAMDRLLDLLARHGVRATFFTLGWVAREHPAIVRRIVAAGHELASHGFWHRRVWMLTPDQMREDLRTSKAILEDVGGVPVHGYRAPTFSITPATAWALELLVEEGYTFDSSIFPVRRPGYGFPGAPPVPHRLVLPGGTLLELPVTTLPFSGTRLPAGGGGYFRQLPYSLTRLAFDALDRAGVPGMFYTHPWELDPEQPRVQCSWLTALRHYRGLARTLPRLDRLLARFRFTSVARRFGTSASDQETALLPEVRLA